MSERSLVGFIFLVFLRLGIEGIHVVDFFRRQLWEMANEVDQLPAALVLLGVTLSPGRHRSESDAVMNDPEDLTVRHRLRIG